MQQQKGFTFWSLAFTISTILIIALLTMKLLPAYTEFFAIKRAINRLATEGSLPAMDNRQIQKAFDRSVTMDDIHSIKPTDLEIRRTSGGDTIVSANYEVVVPIVANISALMTFSASTVNSKSID